MAASVSPSSSSARMSFCCRILYTLFLVVLLLGSSSATRPGRTMMENDLHDKVPSPPLMKSKEILKVYQDKYLKNRRGMVFNLLPKGTPIPPSGPSKRHNLEVSRTTLN